jgi:hypothetical protein
MSQVKDYNLYKQSKLEGSMITTPMHLACKVSNDDAVRFLLEKQYFDINMIHDGRSAVFDLLSSSTYVDFNILNYLLKMSKPEINCGDRLPMN